MNFKWKCRAILRSARLRRWQSSSPRLPSPAVGKSSRRESESAAGQIGQFGLPPPRRKLRLCALASTSFPPPLGSLLTTRFSGPTPAVKEQPVTLTECLTRIARRILQLRGPDPTGSIESLFVSEAREQPACFRFTRACVSERARTT